MKKQSCLRCEFLFTQDTGYSNYTVEDTELHCVYRRNNLLPAVMPDTWGTPTWVGIDGDPTKDRWFGTKNGRCELYRPRPLEFERIKIDVDREDVPKQEQAMEAFLQGDVMPLLVLKYMNGETI